MDEGLSQEEVRVLGALVEKELSTPDYYPMTLNALTAACNQKSNRHPVVAYEEAEVVDALGRLQRRRLVGMASGAYSRSSKYRHALAETYDLDPPALAVLASVMLRGPETVGELRGRTGRMHPFETLDEVEAVLQRLIEREPPLMTELPRRPGQKEVRFTHLFFPPPAAQEDPEEASPGGVSRVEQLEDEVSALRDELEALREAFETFRSQFE